MVSVASLTKLTERVLPGPTPSFSAPHLVLIFLTIADGTYVGRAALAQRANLGEGAGRTILKKLRDAGYVDAVRAGCYLTKSGSRVAASLRITMSLVDVPRSDLSMGRCQTALILRGAGMKVKSGLEQRDSAIKIGASGATTYLMKSGRFTIPGGSGDCEKDYPSTAWTTLRKELTPRNGDAVVLCGAEGEVSARLGAIAAALTLA